jgi:integrase/recombinase XerD
MLSDHFPRAHRRSMSLPLLGSLVDDFHTWLLARGFRRAARERHLAALWRIDRALRRRGCRQWRDVTRHDLEVCWRQVHRRSLNDPAAVRRVQQFAEQTARLTPLTPPPASRVETLTRAYAAGLGDLRGLAPKTIHEHATTAAAFLDSMAYETAPSRLAGVTGSDLETFVRHAGGRLCRASLQHTVARLRSFLRFLAERGAIRPGLDQQIDTPRSYRLEQLPRSLPWATVRALLRSIDQTTPHGLRDYTMLFLITTYGLRASEVVALTLDAIDWRRRLLRVPRQKTGTPLLLPLTDLAGTILVRYLRRGRPSSPRRELFLRAHAPAGELKSSAVAEVFQHWVRRSGLPIPFQGAHCLRHSYAVHLVRRGVSLKTVGDLLGHRTAESTCVYLRLATDDLRKVALRLPRPPASSPPREHHS